MARGQITIGWVGDSRRYWVASGTAGLLTHDHSWLNQVVDAGEMTEAVALRSPQAHALTHCLGALEQQEGESAPVPSVVSFQPPPTASLILCTDGLWNYAPEPEAIAMLIAEFAPDADALTVARGLVDFALDRGGQDNVTAAVSLLP